MIFKLNHSAGQPVYMQIVEQVRHAVESGLLSDGDCLPAIRTLAQELIVSPNTIAKAYSQLERDGLLDLRHGSGAYVLVKNRKKFRTEGLRAARARVSKIVSELQAKGFDDEEIRRMFMAELFYDASVERES